MKSITLSSKVSLRDDLETMPIDDAFVIANGSGGECYGVEGIAKRICQLLQSSMTVSELCDALMQEYEVDRETCEREVLEFLTDSAHEGLIRVLD
jgi:hypothetical protein